MAKRNRETIHCGGTPPPATKPARASRDLRRSPPRSSTAPTPEPASSEALPWAAEFDVGAEEVDVALAPEPDPKPRRRRRKKD